jgi:hypothetical protein
VLSVAALELGHPVTFIVASETGYATFHEPSAFSLWPFGTALVDRAALAKG